MNEGVREGAGYKGRCQGCVKDGARVGMRECKGKCKGRCEVMDGGIVVMIDGWSWLTGWS